MLVIGDRLEALPCPLLIRTINVDLPKTTVMIIHIEIHTVVLTDLQVLRSVGWGGGSRSCTRHRFES